ncbi:hypothetical protein SAMN02744124_00800 [Paenibacillus barengoltzii J12]|uniref:Uncharacterized protein n=2 Tax=Paenibacillus barengoltzii TaxID=343517 RepID=A0ABY1LTM3_9BACL|nr:hypothetical protein SAMN02744124_00800 [Paenibacillus barengoltzii J12]
MIMSLLNLIEKLLLRWGAYKTEKYSTYKPDPLKGYWFNKGTVYNEEWEWVEPNVPTPSVKYVAVSELPKGKYLICIVCKEDIEVGSSSFIEYVDCKREKECYWAITMYKAYYDVLGKVETDEECEKIIQQFNANVN